MTTPSASANTGSEVWSAPAAPRQHDVAGLIGNPGRARGGERNQHQKQNDPIHRNPIAPVWRAPPWPRPRIDGMRRARRRAHRPCRSRLARRRDRPARSVFNSRLRLAKSLRSAAAVTRATTLPRSLPTHRCARCEPVLPHPPAGDRPGSTRWWNSPGAGGDSFGTSVSNSRLRAAGSARPWRQSPRAASAHPDWARAISPPPAPRDRDRRSEPERRARPPPRRGAAAHRPPALPFSCAISAPCARVARSIPAMRSLIAARSGAAAASRGADLRSLTAAASFSDCARRPAISPRNAATDFSSASTRAAAAGSGAGDGLSVLDSMPARRAARSSMAAALAAGCAGAAGGISTSGHPDSHTAPITSAAAPAPETAAMTGGGDRSAEADATIASALRPRRYLGASPDTSVASRSMVGGARLARPESGDGSISSGLSSTIPAGSLCMKPTVTRFGTATVPLVRAGQLLVRQAPAERRQACCPKGVSSAFPGAKHGPTPRTRHFRPATPPP